MTEEKALARTVGTELTVQELVNLRATQLEVIKQIMKDNIHFGKIPGTPKPSLWQPGAQVLDNLHGFASTYNLLAGVEDWEKGFFHYRYKCTIIRRREGIIVGEGIGSCNSREKKYRTAVYHGDDEGMPVDPRDNVNTYEKMAQKRAHIIATLNATGLSDIFTQDVEDMIDQFITEPKERPEEVKKHWCPICNVAFTQRGSGKQRWWSHKKSDGSWCNEADVLKKMASSQETSASPIIPAEDAPTKEELQIKVDWGRTYRIADKMGFPKPSDCSKAVGVKNMSQWTETQELLLERLFERAQLDGRFKGLKSWREIKVD